MSYDCLVWSLKQNIPNSAQSVLNVLAFHVNKNDECWPTYLTLSKETGFSIKTVQRAIHYLEKNNFIRIKRNGYKNLNVYIFNKSYPQETGHGDLSLFERQVKLEERQVMVSRETGHGDLHNINKNINKKCSFNKNVSAQELNNPSEGGKIGELVSFADELKKLKEKLSVQKLKRS